MILKYIRYFCACVHAQWFVFVPSTAKCTPILLLMYIIFQERSLKGMATKAVFQHCFITIVKPLGIRHVCYQAEVHASVNVLLRVI